MPKPELIEQEKITADDEIYTESTLKPHFFRPAVICGICEACGSAHYEGGEMKKVTDKASGQIGYVPTGGKWEVWDATMCPHYKPLYEQGRSLQCSGCGEKFTGSKNGIGKFAEVLGHRTLYVFSFVNDKNRLIMYCDNWECTNKRINRLKN